MAFSNQINHACQSLAFLSRYFYYIHCCFSTCLAFVLSVECSIFCVFVLFFFCFCYFGFLLALHLALVLLNLHFNKYTSNWIELNNGNSLNILLQDVQWARWKKGAPSLISNTTHMDALQPMYLTKESVWWPSRHLPYMNYASRLAFQKNKMMFINMMSFIMVTLLD